METTTTPTMSTKRIRSKQQIRSSSKLSSNSRHLVGPSPDRRHRPPTVSTRRHRRHPTRMGSFIRRVRICSTGMASMVSQMPSTTSTSSSSTIIRAVTEVSRSRELCPRTGTLDTLAIRSWPPVQPQQRPTRTIRSYEYPRRFITPRARAHAVGEPKS